MEPLGVKIVATFVLALATALSGLSPLRLSNSVLDTSNPRHRRTLNALLSFSGGVLFATCFVHLLPDLVAEFESALPPLRPPDSARFMPWGELTVCLGFFLIYGVEETVEYFVCRTGCEDKHHHHEDHHPSADQSSAKDAAALEKSIILERSVDSSVSLPIETCAVSYQNPDDGERLACLSPVHRIHGTHRKTHRQHHCKKGELPPPSYPDNNEDDERQSLLSDDAYLADGGSDHHHHHHPLTDEQDVHEEGEQHQHGPPPSSVQNTMRGLLLVMALSFHSIFEGLAIGLQDSASGVWTSFLAVVLHKLVMAFCVAVELLQLRTKRAAFVAHIVGFSVVAPVGIALGTVVSETGWMKGVQAEDGSRPGPLVLASLQGLACGTLLYVTFFEVLTRTRGTKLNSLLNFVAVLLGFAVIVALHAFD